MSRSDVLSRALVVVVAASLVASAPALAAAKSTNKVRTGPAGVKFYMPPNPLPGSKHGDLIWSRKLTGAAVAPGAASTKLVLYRSQGVAGKPVAVSGIVSLPKGQAPTGGWPVITYAHGTTGIADQCAPSRDVAGTPVHPYNAYVLPLLTRWLKAGYAVVRTDYEGLGTPYDHPYLIGSSEGRSTLDIVRAARQLDPRISAKKVIISGHSQGGHAALFAAALAATWTPDLDVRGTVAFAPASHLAEQIPLTQALTAPGGGLSALVVLIAKGLEIADPHNLTDPHRFDVATVLSDSAISFASASLTECLPELAQPSAAGGLAPAALFKPGADLGPITKLLGRQDPSRLKLRTPLLIEQGAADTTVFPQFTDQLATELKAGGERSITYNKVPGVDHAGIVTAGAKAATTWIAQRLK